MRVIDSNFVGVLNVDGVIDCVLNVCFGLGILDVSDFFVVLDDDYCWNVENIVILGGCLIFIDVIFGDFDCVFVIFG